MSRNILRNIWENPWKFRMGGLQRPIYSRRSQTTQIARFSWFSSLRRPSATLEHRHRFRNDPMDIPDLFECNSDRLLLSELLKTEFSLRNWSGRLCACKGYAPTVQPQRRAHFKIFMIFEPQAAGYDPGTPPPALEWRHGYSCMTPGNRFPIDCCRQSF